MLPALQLRAARRRTPRLRAVAVPQALRPALYPARLLERPRPATSRHPSRVRQRCILRSTAAGFSANDSFLSAALRPHPSSMAIPTPKAGSALDCGLDRCVMRFRISSFHWRNTVCWLTERPPLDFRYSNHGATASSSQPFLNPPQKASCSQPIKGEGIRHPRFHGDDTVEIYTRFRMAGLASTLWIPAFAEMTG